jgi:GDP/UDP-N,N'-diacetylbacillosamine 2-epimerase (hydrolysing)
MSHLHFTSTKEYKNRVIQLGEQPSNVFEVGALGIENINRLNLLDISKFQSSINFKLSDLNFLVTFHPVTLENASSENQFKELLESLQLFKDAKIIFTMPNADHDGRVIIQMIEHFVKKNSDNAIAFNSLGQLRYLSAIKYCDVVIGNSSSGLIEVPYFKKPTINIGDRQRGRIMADSVINCKPIKNSIVESIQLALSVNFQQKLKNVSNPYGKGNCSDIIVKEILNTPYKNILKKKFYNLPIK